MAKQKQTPLGKNILLVYWKNNRAFQAFTSLAAFREHHPFDDKTHQAIQYRLSRKQEPYEEPGYTLYRVPVAGRN